MRRTGVLGRPASECATPCLSNRGALAVERGQGTGTPSLREQSEALHEAAAERIRSTPLVQAALAAFPEAEFVEEPEVAGGRGDRNWSRA